MGKLVPRGSCCKPTWCSVVTWQAGAKWPVSGQAAVCNGALRPPTEQHWTWQQRPVRQKSLRAAANGNHVGNDLVGRQSQINWTRKPNVWAGWSGLGDSARAYGLLLARCVNKDRGRGDVQHLRLKAWGTLQQNATSCFQHKRCLRCFFFLRRKVWAWLASCPR